MILLYSSYLYVLLVPLTQECFNSPYGTNYFPEYAEPIPGGSTDVLAAVAKETKTYLIGGN